MANAMVVFKANRPSNNPNLPNLGITEQEIAILQLNPSAWIEAKSGVVSSGGNVSLVRDKTGRVNWAPVAALTPRIINAGNGKAFRFGRASSNSGALIAQDAHETFPADGIYSIFILYRIPLPNTEGFTGTGGNVCGNYAAEPDRLRVRFGLDSFGGDVVWLNHGGAAAGDPSNYPINTSIAGFRDNQWHISAIEATSSYHRWEQDGVLLQQRDIPAKAFATADSRRLIVGGAGNPLNQGFQGDVTALLVITGILTDENKGLIMGHFNSLKDDLNTQL